MAYCPQGAYSSVHGRLSFQYVLFLIYCGESLRLGGCDGVDAAGLPWFKISEDAYDGTQWASDKLNSSGASWSWKIPAEVAPGYVHLNISTPS